MKGINIIIMLLLFISSCASVSTRLIRDQQGNIVPGSIASLQKVKLGGMDQWILIPQVWTFSNFVGVCAKKYLTLHK